MRPACDLLDEDREGIRLRIAEGLVMIFLANSSLSVFIDPNKKQFVNFHLIINTLNNINDKQKIYHF